jgi:hypothetical protein
VNVRTGKEKAIVFVLLHGVHQIFERLFGEENLTLSVHYVLLKIVGGRFRRTEVLHGIGHSNAHLLAYAEEVINSISAGKDHCLMIGNVYLVFSKLLARNIFNMNKGPEIDLYFKFFRQVEIG